MSDISSALAGTQSAVDDLVAAAEAAEPTWTTPRAPGKWSPSQLTEHVARSLHEGANVVAGRPHKFPKFPGIVRALFRAAFFNRVVKKGTFSNAKTFKPFDPESGPATPAEARERLRAALARFNDECESCAEASGEVHTTTFGTVSVTDYARFNELHIRHHIEQMPS